MRRLHLHPGWLVTLFGVAWLAGCAPLDLGREPTLRPAPVARLERPDAPADYDVLVAELAQAEGRFEEARAAFARAAAKDPDAALLHERLARLAWQMDDLDGAVQEGERALSLDPGQTRVRILLGRLYNLRRDLAGLDRVLRGPDREPLNADAAFTLHQVALERRDLAEAEAMARKTMALEPEQLRGRLALVSVLESKRDWDAAEKIVREGLAQFPGHFLLLMRLAQLAEARGDRPGEIAIYRELLAEHPNHFGVLQRLGQAQIEADDTQGALETFAAVVEHYPDDESSLKRLAALEFAAGRYEASARHFAQLMRREPGDMELAIAVGQVRRAAGDLAGAREAFEHVPVGDAHYVEARIQISALLESQGELREALDEMERLRRGEGGRAVDLRAAALRMALDDFDGAKALLESLLDGSDGDVEVYYQLGVLEGNRKRFEPALAYMEKVLERDPKNAAALNYVGYSWAERGENLDEAEALIQRAIALAPGDGYITDSLGWVYYKMAELHFREGRKDAALALLERARKQLKTAAQLTGGDPVVSEHLGDVHLLRGEKARALDYYEEAVGLEIREAEQPNLLEKLERLRRDLGRRPRASGKP